MAGAFKRLLRQGGIYALGNVAIKASGLFLAPLYLNPTLLSQEGYGELILLEASGQLLMPLVSLGLGTGLLKFMADAHYRDQQSAIPFTALVAAIAGAGVAFGGLWAAAAPLAVLLLGAVDQAYLIRLFAAYLCLKVVGGIPFTLIRIRERPGLFSVAAVAEMGVLIGTVYFFLVKRGLGLEGVLWGFALSAGVSTTLLVVAMLGRVTWQMRPELLGKLIRFGTPLALAGVALPLLHVADRYLLAWLTSTEAVAVYGWAAKLSGILNMFLIQSFQMAFSVIGLKALGETENDATLHRRTFRHYTIWGGWFVVGLSLLAYDVTALLSSNDSYLAAAPLVLPLSLGYLAYGHYILFVNILYALGRTQTVAANVVGAAAFNAVLNLLLIPLLGGMGAALATVASYAGLAYLTARVAERHMEIHIPWRVLLSSVFIILVLWGLAQPSLTWSLWQRLSWRLALVLAYPGLVLLAGLYTLSDVAAGWAWIQEKSGIRVTRR